MKTLQDWAEFYYRNGIYVYPPSGYFDLSKWSTFKETLKDAMSYDWHKYSSIYGMAGKRGIRLLRFNFKEKDELYKKCYIKKVLALLNLDRYPWVIDTGDGIEILINCPSFVDCGMWDKFEDFTVIYKSFFALPALTTKPSFYFHGIPTIKPAYIKEKSLINCINVLNDDTTFLNRYINHITE